VIGRAKKRFGQNFLIDQGKTVKLIESLSLRGGDNVLEVGPGHGALTEEILNKNVNLTAVELDRDLIPGLEERFNHYGQFKLIEADIVKIDPNDVFNGKFKLIGNLPYNISGAMVEWMIKYSDMIELGVITVQKEVATRLRAESHCRDYGSLTVITQSYFDVKRIFDIPPGCFKPAPSITSTALRMSPNSRLDSSINREKYLEFLRFCFAKKRKTLVNSLLPALKIQRDILEQKLTGLGYDKNIRAEQISVEEFYKLYQILKTYAP
jgi:16S rRNA (adenine1518-N6/adenine1519-N6)-dimethyltransferase